MQELLHLLRSNIWAIVGIFVASLVISIVGTGWILLSLPPDHFRKSEHSGLRRIGAPFSIGRLAGRILKNVVGLVLVVLGIIMSLPGVPGQGVLTIVAGLLLMDFPGKQRLERAIIEKPWVLGPINKLRERFGRAAFEL